MRRNGNEMLFQQLTAALGERGAKRIVNCGPHAFGTLKNECPGFGGHYEVLQHKPLVRGH